MITATILQVIFLVLKLTEVIDWQWVLVFIPFITLAFVILLLFSVFFLAQLFSYTKKKNPISNLKLENSDGK